MLSDEAHRTQYGSLALNMRAALLKASFLGFTGTPLFSNDQITRQVFGEYVSTYDFQRAVEDGATVPLYYDARGEKLGLATTELNEKIAAIEEAEINDLDVAQRLEAELKRHYHIITAERRLEQVAEDFVRHYSEGWERAKRCSCASTRSAAFACTNLFFRHGRNALRNWRPRQQKSTTTRLRKILREWISHYNRGHSHSRFWGRAFRIQDQHPRLGSIVIALSWAVESRQLQSWADFTMNMRSNEPPCSLRYDFCGPQRSRQNRTLVGKMPGNGSSQTAAEE